MPAGLFILFGIVIVVVIAASAFFSMKRRQELIALCQARGLQFSADEVSIEDQFPNFKFLQEGDDRYACNTMRGEWGGRPILMFDYHYETESRDSEGHRKTDDHDFSAAILSSTVPLKPLFIRPEGLFDKLGALFGFEDINFESVEFSRKFYVTAADKKWAFDVIHPRMMEFLLAAPRFNIQFDEFQIVAYHSESTFTAAEFAAAAGLLAGMLDRLPEYLVKQQAGE